MRIVAGTLGRTFIAFVTFCAPVAFADVVVETVAFENDGLRLHGQVHLPAQGDGLPGIVLIQGSGASGIGNQWARMIADAFADCGFAVLLPDKRGVGRSEGDWRTAGFDELGADAVASLRALEAHDRVAAGRVGFMGLSQGGHIAPLAAARVENIPFVVNVVGALTVMEQQLYHELHNTYLEHGIEADTIEYLQTLARRSFDYLRDASAWDNYLARRTEIANGPLALAAESWPDSRDDPYWVFWGKIYDFDPMPHWRTLALERDVPSLMLFGAEDEHDNVPVAASLEAAKTLVEDDDFEIRVYPDSGHALFAPGTHQLRRDMVEGTARWLREALARLD